MTEPRDYPLFAQCGLNCGLCPIYHITNQEKSCPGCGGGPGAQNCKLRRCAKQRGGLEYCFECREFPCAEYAGITDADSFITHRNMINDQQRAQAIGLDAYKSELEGRMDILLRLLEGYNDGRRKTLFCTATNLLPLQDLQQVMRQLQQQADPDDLKARGKLAASMLQAKADELDISLKLRRRAPTAPKH